MAVYHLFLTIYSQNWTIYIHITLDFGCRKHLKKYIVPRKRLATAQKYLAYIGVKIWESLELCFQKEMQVTLLKSILTRVNYMLP